MTLIFALNVSKREQSIFENHFNQTKITNLLLDEAPGRIERQFVFLVHKLVERNIFDVPFSFWFRFSNFSQHFSGKLEKSTVFHIFHHGK